MNYKEYDLIWMHHNILADYVLFQLKVKSNRIIYSSLSPYEPLEAVPEYAAHLSYCLANSEETKNAILEENDEIYNIQVFPNFVPQSFLNYNTDRLEVKEIKNIAIVSNHLPKELLDIIQLLKKLNINVDVFGIGYKIELVDEKVLLNYDAVISIGKTVQYCMALGVPIYCYDIHGGPGWLNREIINKAAYFNFSGRGFAKKTAEEIVCEIQLIPDNVEFLRNYVKQYCCLETNLLQLLQTVPISNLELLYRKEKAISRKNQAIIHFYRLNMLNEMKLIDINNQRENSHIQCAKYSKQLNDCRDNLEVEIYTQEEYEHKSNELQNVVNMQISELNQKEATCRYLIELCAEKDATINSIYSSRSWKIITPFRRARNKTKSIVKHLQREMFRQCFRLKKVLIKPQIDGRKYPLVTVGIPVYDRTEFLIQSLESILNQTYPNIEIIAVCDGSPPETLEIIKQYEKEKKSEHFIIPITVVMRFADVIKR